jgi:hypothetical protein
MSFVRRNNVDESKICESEAVALGFPAAVAKEHR